jgi:aminopeptidase YwaD
MKRTFPHLFLLFILLGSGSMHGQQHDPHTLSRLALREHVTVLASDSLQGRLFGTEGNLIAGEYIADRFADIGLEEFNGTSYFHYFNVEIPSAVREIPLVVLEGCNVVGVLPGTDPKLKNEYIIVGAHYDHLGSLSGKPGVSDTVYNGADDNASGTAVLIETARALKEKGGLSRTVVFVAFDGEEQGLWGSDHFLKDSLYPARKIKTMISLDMVGYYRTSGVLKVIGSGTLEDSRQWLPDSDVLKVRFIPFENSLFGATDTRCFAQSRIPTLFVTTGKESPYHQVEDQTEGIDYEGLVGVTSYVSGLVSTLAGYSHLAPSGKYAVIHHVPEYAFLPGITFSIGTNRFRHTRGVLEGRPAFYAAVGADARFLWKGFLELNPALQLEYIGARHAEAPGVSYMNRIHMLALGVPLSVRVYFPHFNNLPIGCYASLSTYYRYYIAGQISNPVFEFDDVFRRHEWGIGIGFGVRASVFQIGYEIRLGLTDRFRPGVVEGYNVRNSMQAVTFSYFF